MTEYTLPEGMTATSLRIMATNLKESSSYALEHNADCLNSWADAIDPPEPESVVTAEMVEAFISEYRRAGRFADTTMARDALEAVERLGWLDGEGDGIDWEAACRQAWSDAEEAGRENRAEIVHLSQQNNDLRKRLHDLESADDEEYERLRNRLAMAEGLLRLASNSTRPLTNSKKGWEWECHPTYISADEAEYLRSLTGETGAERYLSERMKDPDYAAAYEAGREAVRSLDEGES